MAWDVTDKQKKAFKQNVGKDDNTTIEDLFMEKICIVRRRIQIPAPPQQPTFGSEREEKKPAPVSTFPLLSGGNGKQHKGHCASAVHDEDHVIRIQLSQDQCKVIRADSCVNHILGRIIGDIDLDLEHYEDGQIVFNFHLKQVQRADMLDGKKVCHMLQISRSFLSRLVKNDQIKSYKIGRLRRFLLEDILEYLSQGEMDRRMTRHVSGKTNTVLVREQLQKQPVS